jgi:poly(3-hydroxybutyrate) depolymerase
VRLGRGARVRILLAAVAAGALASALPGAAAPAPRYALEGGKGHVDYRLYGKLNGGLRYDYLVYRPVGWKKTDRLPLYVALHGCAMSGFDMMAATWLNPIADRERFLVAYPDNQSNCWHAVSDDGVIPGVDQKDITRGAGGDADIVAGITKRIIAAYNVDRTRVYLAGGSAGAFQTAAASSAYPELYAAIGIVAGPGPGMAVTCVGYPDSVVPAYAKWAVAQMGKRAHVIPFFAIGGTVDPLGETAITGGCTHRAYQEMLYINNMLRPSPKSPMPGMCGLLPPRVTSVLEAQGTCVDTYMTNPYATRHGQAKDGYRWTRHSAQDTSTMCEIGEEWIVKGMGHTWSGGSGNPAMQGDPRGPKTSDLTWYFFKRFRLVHGQVVCHQNNL